MRPMTLAVLHVRTSRPHDPGFQAELDELTVSVLATAGALGLRSVPVASAEVGIAATLRAVAACDAVVILGGEDVEPSTYGGPEHYEGQGRHEPVADEAHLEVVRSAVQDGRPLLGICRGLQLVGVALGGTLVPHLPTTDLHRAVGADPYVVSDVAVDARISGDLVTTGGTRCTHHQALDVVPAELEVVARAADGVVEAVVHRSAPLTAVQWHPEHPDVAATQLAPLLTRLAAQCVSRAVA